MSYWTVFYSFTALWTQKIKIKKNQKKMKKTPEDIIILQTLMTFIWCMVPQIWSARTEFFVILDCFLPFTTLTAQKIKIFKKWKKRLEISSFYICVSKIVIRWCTVPVTWCAADGWMDGQKKWHIEVVDPSKKFQKQIKV